MKLESPRVWESNKCLFGCDPDDVVSKTRLKKNSNGTLYLYDNLGIVSCYFSVFSPVL